MTALPIFCVEYFDFMDSHPRESCRYQWAERRKIEEAFACEDLTVRLDLYDKYIKLGGIIGFKRGYEWERYIIGLFFCVYQKDGLPRWDELFVEMGRGNGKDGLIEWIALIGISPYNPAKRYDVDICAFNEKQALRPVHDLYQALMEDPVKNKKHFEIKKEKITGRVNGGYVKGHTNNAKGKDGLRSGIIIFNEIHTYENFDNINVFTTGLGKKDDPRTAYFTTNGDVVGGPLDVKFEEARRCLFEGEPDNGVLYMIYQLDEKEEVHDEMMWRKANPSLRYKPALLNEIRKEYDIWNANHFALPAFMTKRMNIRQMKEERPVAKWEQVEATKKTFDHEKLRNWECTAGVDFARTTDWVAVNLHFKDGEKRYDINHAWICTQNDQIGRLKCPYRDWAKQGLVTLVDAPEIAPELVADYLSEMNAKYDIVCVSMDSYRYALLKGALERVGFSAEDKNIYLYRPSDIMRIGPVIERYFVNESLYWGDQPVMRWATNNVKLVPAKRSKLVKDGEELDVGNWLYGKIEPQARKTDPFMAFAASVVVEEKITDYGDANFDFDVFSI